MRTIRRAWLMSIMILVLVIAPVSFLPAPAQGSELGGLIAAFATPAVPGIAAAVWTVPGLPIAAQVAPPSRMQTAMARAVDMQVDLLEYRMIQRAIESVDPPTPQRRSLVGLTATGGAAGALTGAAVAALFWHVGVIGGAIDLGTTLILGAFAGL